MATARPVPRIPEGEGRGIFRIFDLAYGATHHLCCSLCYDPVWDLFVNDSPGAERDMAGLMDEHLKTEHPPTIRGMVGKAPPGWRPLLLKLHDRITEIDPGYRLEHLGEMLGMLTIDLATDQSGEIENLIACAELASTRTCQFCGYTPARPVEGDWRNGPVKICCEAHGGGDGWSVLDEADVAPLEPKAAP